MNRRINVTQPQAKARSAPEAIAQAELERLVERIVARQLDRLPQQAVAPQIDAELNRPGATLGAAKQPADAPDGAEAARKGASDGGETGAEVARDGADSDAATGAAKAGESASDNASTGAAKARENEQKDAAAGAGEAGEDDDAEAARVREDALNRREAELDRRELRAWVADEMRIRELPAELAEVVDLSDARRCADAVDALEKAFRRAVQRGVDERIGRGCALPHSTGDVPAGMSQRMRAAAGLM